MDPFQGVQIHCDEAMRMLVEGVPAASNAAELLSVIDAVVHLHPIYQSLALLVVFTLVLWLLSIMTDNYSWVDRAWSLVPIIYACTYTVKSPFVWNDANLMFILIAIWGCRLTYNFYRKGGYQLSGEDYRWQHVKSFCFHSNIPFVPFIVRWLIWQLFNLLFVALYQNLLLWWITTPVFHVANNTRKTELDALSIGLFFTGLMLILLETLADQQQWTFHQKKAKQPNKFTFLSTGLFAYSRHPNFFAEMAFWCHLAVWSLLRMHLWWHGCAFGALNLVLLFQGSTTLTEAISVSKYGEAYRTYQRNVSRLLPLPPSFKGAKIKKT
jgi:steroid 5-alpha reductase family enzyme